MIIRELTEKHEVEILSQYAVCSKESKGRIIEEDLCDIRTVFQRDRDRIIHAKAFRRLMHKTQVFLSPEGDHYRTRLTHTIEVSQIARTIARALRLNEDLTEAIALGHDLGHTPFGHCGEAALNDIHQGGFKHNVQSLRVVEFIEMRNKNYRGLNLTEEVRDGILHHSGPGIPFTLEGQIVKLSDRIAYINHDIEDAIRGNVLSIDDIPAEYIEIFGETSTKRINTMIRDVVRNSMDQDIISMSKPIKTCMDALRQFMFTKVYTNPEAKGEEEKAMTILKSLYKYFVANPSQLPDEYIYDNGEDVTIGVKDYIAGMSDRYAIAKYTELFVPSVWTKKV